DAGQRRVRPRTREEPLRPRVQAPARPADGVRTRDRRRQLRKDMSGRSARDRPDKGGAGGVEVPLLVVAAPAGVDLELGAVAGAGGVEAAARLDADDGAVGVDAPLLVVAAPAGVDLHPGAVAGAACVEALVAVDADLLRGVVGPLLVTAGVAVPELELGAVRGAGVGYVHAPAGLDAADLPVRARRGVSGCHGRRGPGARAVVQAEEADRVGGHPGVRQVVPGPVDGVRLDLAGPV